MARIGFTPVPMTMPTGKLGPFDPRGSYVSAGDQLNSFLSPYGLQLPTQINTNTLFPGAQEGAAGGFEGRHPQLFNILQNALLGAALTPDAKGPEGAGAGLGRALQGAMAIPEYQRGKALEQFMAPFQVADMMSGLQSRQAVDNYYNAMGQAVTERSGATADKAAAYQQIADLKTALGNSAKPTAIPGLGIEYYTRDSNGNYAWTLDTSKIPPLANRGAATPGSLEERYIHGMLGPEPDPTDTKASQAYWSKATALMGRYSQTNAAGAAAGHSEGTPGNLTPTAKVTLSNNQAALNKQLTMAQQTLKTLQTMQPGARLANGLDDDATYKKAVSDAQGKVDFLTKAASNYTNRFLQSNGAVSADEYMQELLHPEWGIMQQANPAIPSMYPLNPTVTPNPMNPGTMPGHNPAATMSDPLGLNFGSGH